MPRLQALGVDALALPLIGIASVADEGPLLAAWARLEQYRLVVFVSPNAVDHFFARRPDGRAWCAGVHAASPGPGTTQVLLTQGLAAAQVIEPASDSAQFDSEALWQQLSQRDWRGADVLIVRGEGGGREWLAQRLREQGATVDLLAAYRRCDPQLDDSQLGLLEAALAEPERHVWFFSSSEAVDRLQALAPAAAWSRARAVATHPRIAERAQRAGFGTVVASHPSLEAVAACLQSLAL